MPRKPIVGRTPAAGDRGFAGDSQPSSLVEPCRPLLHRRGPAHAEARQRQRQLFFVSCEPMWSAALLMSFLQVSQLRLAGRMVGTCMLLRGRWKSRRRSHRRRLHSDCCYAEDGNRGGDPTDGFFAALQARPMSDLDSSCKRLHTAAGSAIHGRWLHTWLARGPYAAVVVDYKLQESLSDRCQRLRFLFRRRRPRNHATIVGTQTN